MIALAFLLLLGHEPTAYDAEKNWTEALTVKDGQAVLVTHAGGDLRVHPAAPGSKPRAELKMFVSGGGDQEEEAWLNGTSLTATTGAEGVLRVQTVLPPAERQPEGLSYVAELQLWLPVQSPLVLDNRYGAVEVNGREAGLEVTNRLGPVLVRRCSKGVLVRNEYDQVRIEQCQGRVEVHNSESVELLDIQGETYVENKFGPVTITRVRGGLTIHNRNAKITVHDVIGPVELTGAYCPIELRGIEGRMHLSGQGADVEGRDLSGDLEIQQRNGGIRLQDLAGGFTVRGSLLSLDVRGVTGPILVEAQASSLTLVDARQGGRVEVTTGGIHLVDVRGPLEVAGRNGLVRVEFSALPVTTEPTDPPGAIRLENHGSPVELVLPASASCVLTLQSTLSPVESEFPGMTQSRNGRVHRGRQVLGEGLVPLEVMCIDGVVRVLRRGDAPDRP